jgi:tRNA threonylcarbamoyladenosine biosynthesis protein TsaE
MKIVTNSVEETIELGARFGEQLQSGDVVALIGNLGSGKTHFTRGICRGLQVTQPVTSPTFVLINEYRGRLPVYHFDFYRLESEAEIWDLGIEDYLSGDGVCVIEWAERGLKRLPENRIEIHLRNLFDTGLETSREFNFRGKAFSPARFNFITEEATN